jgi:hypothetical protein
MPEPSNSMASSGRTGSLPTTIAAACLILFQVVDLVQAQGRYNLSCGIKDSPFQSLAKLDNSSFLYLCIHFMPYQVKMGFPIKVDEYTVLEIPDSFDFVKDKLPGATIIHPQLGNTPFYGPGNWYNLKAKSIVQSVMHLVIQVQEGNLVGMRWVEGCHGCNVTTASDCRKGNSFSYVDYIQNSTVTKSSDACGINYCPDTDKKHHCNLKIYIGWEGTDFNGNYLVTTSQMLPNFAKQNGGDMFENQKILKFEGPVNSRANIDSGAQTNINTYNKA